MTRRRPLSAGWIAWPLLTAVSGGLYALIAHESSQFEYRQPFVDRPIPVMLALLGAAFAVYLLAALIAARWAPSRGQLGLIAGAALLYRLILLPTPPIQEVDIYRYLWDGIVVSQGINPFRFPPQAVREARLRRRARPRLARLVQVRDADPHVRTLLERIHYAELPSVYPPVSQAVFAAAAWTTPAQATVAQRTLILKIWLLGFDLATGALVLLLLRETGRPLGMFILYAWCPLVLKEFSNSGHLDAIAVFLTTLAMWFAVRFGRVRAGQGRGDARNPRREPDAPLGRRGLYVAGRRTLSWRSRLAPSCIRSGCSRCSRRWSCGTWAGNGSSPAAGCSSRRRSLCSGRCCRKFPVASHRRRQACPSKRRRLRLPPSPPIPAAACGPS